MSRLHLVATLAALVIGGCAAPASRAQADAPPAAKQPTTAPAKVIQAAIVALSEREGEVLAEIPLGSADQVEPGTLLRVYADHSDRRTLKGMLQVTEVLGDHRAIARSIGLTDRAAPLQVGDLARMTDLASTMTDYQAQLKSDAQQREAGATGDDAAFAKIREQYQRELNLAQARFEQQAAQEQAAHDRAVAELTAKHQRELDARALEHQADRTALSATMREQTAKAIAADRAERDQRLRDLQAENQRLTLHTERIVQELQRCQQALAKAEAEATAREAEHAKALRAEIESRQVLQARLTELDQRINGKPVTATAVLSNDPSRSETVLTQLDRLTAELQAAKQEQQRLADELATAKATHEAAIRQLEEARNLAGLLPAAQQAGAAAAQATRQAEQAAETARQLAAMHERARLEAERQLFDLASRILALDGKPESVTDLQVRLQQLVAATPGGRP